MTHAQNDAPVPADGETLPVDSERALQYDDADVELEMPAAVPLATPTAETVVPVSSRRLPGWFYTFLPNKMGLGATINLPPLFLTEVLPGSVAAVGVASALTSAATVPAAWLWGWLSDRRGSHRFYLILGYLGFSIPTILTAFTTQVWQYMVLAVLLGAWSVAGTPVSSTLIMSTTPKTDWDVAFGRFNAINGWGVVGGRLLGLVLIAWGVSALGNEETQRGIWLLSGGLSLLSVLWALITVPRTRPIAQGARTETPRLPTPALGERMGNLARWLRGIRGRDVVLFFRQILPAALLRGWRNTRIMLRDPLILYYLASFVLFTVSVMAYTPFAVWQRQELLNSAATVFLVGMMNSVASALTFTWMGKQIKKYGSIRVQMWTIGSRIVTFAGFALVGWLGLRGIPSVIALVALNLLSGLGWAGIAVAGNTTVANLAPRGSEGAAVGAYTSFVSIGSIAGALVSGFLVLLVGFEWVFTMGAVGIAFTMLVLGLVRKAAPAGTHV